MVKRAVLKIVVLPNSRRFAARYERATRASLPANVMLNRTYKQRASPWNRQERRQRGRRIGSLNRKLFKDSIVIKHTKEVLKQGPKVYWYE